MWHAPVNRFEDMLDDGQANDVGAFVEVPGVSHKLIALCACPTHTTHSTEHNQQQHHTGWGPDAAVLLTPAYSGAALRSRPVQLSASKDLPGPAFGAPELSEHTDEVLGELGFTEAEVARLKAEGVTK